jgi:hypothetical protein
VQRCALRPSPAPVVPRPKRLRDLLEVGQRHAVGNEARAPVRDRRRLL